MMLVALLVASFPAFSGYVLDQQGFFTGEQRAAAEQVCKSLDDAGQAQLAVAVVAGLEGEDLRAYAAELFRQWKLGHSKERADGLLLVIGPPNDQGKRRFRVEVGYGLEGALPDGKVGALLDATVAKSPDGAGALRLLEELAAVVRAQGPAPVKAAPPVQSQWRPVWLLLAAIAFVAVMNRRRKGLKTYAVVAAIVFGAVVLAFLGPFGPVAKLVFGLLLIALAVQLVMMRLHRCEKCGGYVAYTTAGRVEPGEETEGFEETEARCRACGHTSRDRTVLPSLRAEREERARRPSDDGPRTFSDDAEPGGGTSTTSAREEGPRGGGGESGGGGADREV